MPREDIHHYRPPDCTIDPRHQFSATFVAPALTATANTIVPSVRAVMMGLQHAREFLEGLFLRVI
jgi:hypothetical protein